MTNDSWTFNQPVLLKKSRRNSSALSWTLFCSTLFALGWAIFAPLPETVAVKGKLQPSSPIQNIESPLPGVVENISIKEGDIVKEGQDLLRIDPRDIQTRIDAATLRRSALQNQITMNLTLLGEKSEGKLSSNQLELLRSIHEQNNAERNRDEEALMRAKIRLQGFRERYQTAAVIAKRYQQLFKSGAASELQLLTAQNRADQRRNDILAVEREVNQLSATANMNISNRKTKLRQEIESNLRRIADLDREINKGRLDLNRISIKAPIDGTVFNLRINKGSLIEKNEQEPLLKLIPQDNLQAKVYIPNNAIGFVQVKQRANISLTAFKASDYNILPATIKSIGSDALTADEQQKVLGTSAMGLYFPAILQLSRQSLEVNGRSIPLQAGMSLTADIHLRNRRFLSVVTDLFDNKRRSLERLR